MTTTKEILRKIGKLTKELDDNVIALGGYALSFKHYDHDIGKYHLTVQVFPDTAEDGQAATDVLGMTFHQDEDRQYSYSAVRDDVRFTFMLDYEDVDVSVYPVAFIPAPKLARR